MLILLYFLSGISWGGWSDHPDRSHFFLSFFFASHSCCIVQNSSLAARHKKMPSTLPARFSTTTRNKNKKTTRYLILNTIRMEQKQTKKGVACECEYPLLSYRPMTTLRPNPSQPARQATASGRQTKPYTCRVDFMVFFCLGFAARARVLSLHHTAAATLHYATLRYTTLTLHCTTLHIH